MHAHKMTSLYYLLCHMQSADQYTLDNNMISLDCYSLLQLIIAPAFDHCVGSVAKTINFHGYGMSQDQRGGWTDPFCGVQEAVYLKSVLHNHHTKQMQLTIIL